MTSEVEEAVGALKRLLALTPDPPTDRDPAEIIALSSAMLDQRETELAILKLALLNAPDLLVGNQEGHALRDEISLRDLRWTSVLESANRELFKRRQAAQRARQAQRAYRRSA